MFSKIIIIVVSIFLLSGILAPFLVNNYVLAQRDDTVVNSATGDIGKGVEALGEEASGKSLGQIESARRAARFAPPTKNLGLWQIALTVIRIVLLMVGSVFLAMLVYGGYIWLTAGGNEERVKKARSTLVNSIIGMSIIIFSLGITLAINTILFRSTAETSGGYIGGGISTEGVYYETGTEPSLPGSGGGLGTVK